MFPGVVPVARTLPIDGSLLDDALLRLRRDSSATLRWTLGTCGSAEVDTTFVEHDGRWATCVRLWNAAGRAVTAATLQLAAAGPDEVSLTLEPTLPPASAWGDDGEDLVELARAAADEFAEELLWHASRAGFTQRG